MYSQWQQNQAVSLRCIDKWQETPDCVSFRLQHPEKPQSHSFKPGQFISLGIDLDGKTEYRAYSISSLPSDPFLQLTVKRVEGGKVSNHLVDHLKIGDDLQVLRPAGEFNCIDHPPAKRKALLISAGCGITPVFSMANYWLSQNQAIDIQFLHIARNKQLTIYFDQLETMQAVHSDFSLSLLLKDAQGTRHPQGRLNKEWLSELVVDLYERTVFLCGPKQFMLDVKQYLSELNFDMNHFFEESFTPNESEAVSQAEEQQSVTLSVPAFGQSFTVNSGEVLADALENAGLPLIVACRSGICGSCKCKVTKGNVTSTSQETLTDEEIEQGYVLACSSTIKGDIEAELN